MEEVVRIAEELDKENNARMAQDPLVQESLKTVEAFLKTHPVLCYGGTAINNLLPPEAIKNLGFQKGYICNTFKIRIDFERP